MVDVLDEFTVVDQADSVVMRANFEGTNASRFAIAAALGSGRYSDRLPLDIVPLSNFERFGFNPEVARFGVEGSQTELGFAEARAFIRDFGDEWSSDDVRVKSWRDLNEGRELTARFGLLLGGLCSPLERESATAAVAIINSKSPATQSIPARVFRQGGWFDYRSVIPFFFGGLLPWPAASVFEDGAPEVPAIWQGDEWADLNRYFLQDVIKFGDASELLSVIGLLARWRVELALRSADPVARELAMASYLIASEGPTVSPSSSGDRSTSSVQVRMSTMVHGTWGWKGNWWYSGGDFHRYIRDGYRTELYEGGMEFSWSGAYSNEQRELGGARFKRWVDSAGGARGLRSVFAHSYGGEVVARAVNAGAEIDEVIFLSAPIHGHHIAMCDRVDRVVDVRLRNDIVLVLARARQVLPARTNVISHFIERSLWSHSASHDPRVWRSEEIARKVAL